MRSPVRHRAPGPGIRTPSEAARELEREAGRPGIEETAPGASGTEPGDGAVVPGAEVAFPDPATAQRAAAAEETEGRLLLAEVQSLLAELHGSTGAPVRFESDLISEFGFDSLAVVELHDRLEHVFGVRLSEDVLKSAETPADWLRAVRSARGESPPVLAAQQELPPLARRPGELWPEGAETLTGALAWHVEQHPDLVSIRLLGTEPGTPVDDVTYGALATEAGVMAAGLHADGLARGERVAIMLPTGREYFTVFLGILLAGGVPVPIYPPARLSVLEEHLRRQSRLLENAGAVGLVTVAEAKMAARLMQPHVPTLRIVRTPEALAEAGRHAGGPVAIRQRAEAGTAGEPMGPAQAGDLALIQYTSGSTGDPKGVALTHTQLLANVRAMVTAVDLTSSDVIVSWLPLYHDMGLIGVWHTSLVYGVPLVIMSPLTFLARPASWLEAIATYSGTLSAAPNFAYQSCVDRVSETEIAGLDLSHWRLAFNGSEPVDAAVLERFADRFGPCGFRREALCPAYGLAEVGVALAFTAIGCGPSTDRVDRSTLQRSGRAVPAAPGDPEAITVVGCGTPLPGYEIRVVDHLGDELPERREGIVECRGPSAIPAYFASDAASREMWRHGWLDTGDLGYFAGGELYLTGRAKDLVIRGGRNLHPEDLEQALGEVEGIIRGGVAVFGSPDPLHGTERLVVVVETEIEAPEARAELEARVKKVTLDVLRANPDEVVLSTRGAVLRTPSGKIRRLATRQAYEAGVLGRPSAPGAIQLVRFAWSGVGPAGRQVLRLAADRWFAFTMWAIFGVVVAPLWVACLLPLPRRVRWRMTRAAARSIATLSGIGVRIEGDLPAKGQPALVVANHSSIVDSVALCLASPDPLVFVASTDLERQPLVGTFLRRIGCVFVERGREGRDPAVVERLAALARVGYRLVVFPEGSVVRAPGLRPFRLGAFAAATAAGIPVVPVGISGSRDVLRAGALLPHRADVTVTIGAPISPVGTGFSDQVELRDVARHRIGELSGESETRPAAA